MKTGKDVGIVRFDGIGMDLEKLVSPIREENRGIALLDEWEFSKSLSLCKKGAQLSPSVLLVVGCEKSRTSAHR
jgi:hypothetical protein